ncbi:hypothetical protein ACSBR1_023117 [Camellia fascicularis]
MFFLEDYIRSDFNLNEFFMHFESVLYEKQYKELEAGYALCQRLPKVKATIRMLIQMVVDVGRKHARKVKMERDGSLGCNCTKFEREGILCSHSLKGNDIQVDVKFQKASWYKTLMTTFRATACRAAETEETHDFVIAQVATLGVNVECKLSAYFTVENEVHNEDETQSFEVDCEDDNHVVQPKGLKKKVATSKG